MNQTLLPAGCYDVLPPFARLEDQLSYQLLSHFEAYGYAQVSPPLLEYTDSLLAGRGAVLAPQVIRMMDPHTQRVMGVRADMTLQIGRIATSRMADAARPLRLCYAGSVLRMQANDAASKRERHQTGIELIGAESATADAEVILISLRALQSTGVGHITIDINLPVFIGTVLAESSLDNDELTMVFEALSHKDSTRLHQFKEPACDLLCELMQISGNALETLAKLDALPLPDGLQEHLEHLRAVIVLLDAQKGDNVTITLDVTERSGLDYYSGISFAFFATEQSAELGRGGRYIISRMDQREMAMGCTFYTDSLLKLLPTPSVPSHIYVTDGIMETDIARLQNQGYVTILALPGDHAGGDIRNTARRLGCDFIYQSGNIQKL